MLVSRGLIFGGLILEGGLHSGFYGMSRIILKWINLNYSFFDIAEVNFKCVMLGILEGAYQKLAPNCEFVFLFYRRPMTNIHISKRKSHLASY